MDEEIIDLVSEYAREDIGRAVSLVSGLLIGLCEVYAQDQGEDNTLAIELVDAPRKITIDAKEDL